jgi:GxxExxY protein
MNIPEEKKTNMDIHDKQDRAQKYSEITEIVIGCAFEVINELGTGFLESVYEKDLLIALRHKGLIAEAQVPIHVIFREQNVGNYFADILVEKKVIVELKAIKSVTPVHQSQIINYLNATGFEVGLLLNFGSGRLDYSRFTRTK